MTLLHASLSTSAGVSAGNTIAASRTAEGTGAVNVGVDGPVVLCSEAAQQLSACACVTPRRPCAFDLCIGHWTPSTQQAMRASGVAAHPAQSAALSATSTSVSTAAANGRPSLSMAAAARRPTFSTPVECLTDVSVSIPLAYQRRPEFHGPFDANAAMQWRSRSRHSGRGTARTGAPTGCPALRFE
jgi:hypothetical protein